MNNRIYQEIFVEYFDEESNHIQEHSQLLSYDSEEFVHIFQHYNLPFEVIELIGQYIDPEFYYDEFPLTAEQINKLMQER